jgi:hypothetical protein
MHTWMSQKVSGKMFLKFCFVGCTADCVYRNLWPSGRSAWKIRVIMWGNDDVQTQLILCDLPTCVPTCLVHLANKCF